jgi:UDP-N-acetylmuramate dehydrogenase
VSRAALEDAVRRLESRFGERLRRDEPIGPLTTYRVGGAAAALVTVGSSGDLAAVRDAVEATGVGVLVVGKGSNLLVADAGFPGLAVVLGEPFEELILRDTKVLAGAAASLPVVARRTAAAGLTGFEWAVGVPGSIGGAVRMNAGGHGSDMAATLQRVRVVDLAGGEDGWVPAPALALGYRRSSIGPTQVVVEAELALAPGDRHASEAAVAEIVRWRRANQPGGQNAGSVFTNPTGDSAGRLVEAAGLKGRRRGTATVSDKHANFIIADTGGRADDVYALMVEVQREVWQAVGVWLEAETRLVGFPTPDRPLQVDG